MTMKELGIENDMPRGWKQREHWRTVAYHLWKELWKRVKDPSHPSYMYYKDCKIHEKFRLFSNFIKFIESESSFEDFKNTCHNIRWSIDKDMKVDNNRLYYPEYMTLCTQSENSKKMRQNNLTPNSRKPIIGISIEDKKVLLFKSRNAVIDKGFNVGCIYKCLKNPSKNHKGYKWYYINYKHNRKYRIKG